MYVPKYLSMQQRLDIMEAEITLAIVINTLEMSKPVEVPKLGTAKALAILNEDGFASGKQWKRAAKRARKMGIDW